MNTKENIKVIVSIKSIKKNIMPFIDIICYVYVMVDME